LWGVCVIYATPTELLPINIHFEAESERTSFIIRNKLSWRRLYTGFFSFFFIVSMDILSEINFMMMILTLTRDLVGKISNIRPIRWLSDCIHVLRVYLIYSEIPDRSFWQVYFLHWDIVFPAVYIKTTLKDWVCSIACPEEEELRHSNFPGAELFHDTSLRFRCTFRLRLNSRSLHRPTTCTVESNHVPLCALIKLIKSRLSQSVFESKRWL